MEDILDLYERPLEPGEVKVCVDERPYQLLADVRPPLPMEPGQPAREDYTYERKGTCNLFVVLAPDLGWRDVVVTEQRTKEVGLTQLPQGLRTDEQDRHESPHE